MRPRRTRSANSDLRESYQIDHSAEAGAAARVLLNTVAGTDTVPSVLRDAHRIDESAESQQVVLEPTEVTGSTEVSESMEARRPLRSTNPRAMRGRCLTDCWTKLMHCERPRRQRAPSTKVPQPSPHRRVAPVCCASKRMPPSYEPASRRGRSCRGRGDGRVVPRPGDRAVGSAATPVWSR